MSQTIPSGTRLHEHLRRRSITPFIGIYDVFSASLAARQFDALFGSGLSFAAGHYGLSDVGFISWPGILNFVQRVWAIRTLQALRAEDGLLSSGMNRDATLITCNEVLLQNLNQRGT